MAASDQNFILAVRVDQLPNRAVWPAGAQSGFACAGCKADMMLSREARQLLADDPTVGVRCITCTDATELEIRPIPGSGYDRDDVVGILDLARAVDNRQRSGRN